MARTEITKLTVSRTGVTEVKTKIPTDGLKILNDGKILFRLDNTHTGSIVVTFVIAAALDGQTPSGKTVTLDAAGGTAPTKYVGPFPTAIYNQAGGYFHMDAATADKVDVTPLYIETTT